MRVVARPNRNANPIHDSGSRVRTRRGPNRLQRFWRAHKQWYTDNIDVALLRQYVDREGPEAAFVEARCGTNGGISSIYPALVKLDLDELGNAYKPAKGAPPSVTAEVNTAITLTQVLGHSREHGFPPFPFSHTLFPAIPLGVCPEVEDVPLTGTAAPIDSAQLRAIIEQRFPPNVALSPYRHHPHQIYTHGQPIPGAFVNAPPTTDTSLPFWTFSHKLWGENHNHIQVWSRQPSNREIVIKHIRYTTRESWENGSRWLWLGTPEEGVQTAWLAEAYFMYRLSSCKSILEYYGSGYDDVTGIARIGMQCADFGELNFLCERRSLTLESSQHEATFAKIVTDCDAVDTSAKWTALRAGKFDRSMVSKEPPDAPDWQKVLAHLVTHANLSVRDPMRALIRDTAIPESFIWHAFRSLAIALVALQRQQIIHRDIKPNNIFLTTLTDPTDINDNGGWRYKVLLADLGSAVHFQDLRPVAPEGGIWQSPEAHRGALEEVPIVVANELSYKSDLWDVASIIWYMMDPHLCNSGLAVFDPSDNQWRQVQDGAEDDDGDAETWLMQPRLLIGSLYSGNLKNLVTECLEKDPNDRPTAQDLLNRIDARIADGTVVAAPADGGVAYFADLTCNTCGRHEKMCKCACAVCGNPSPECPCPCPTESCDRERKYSCNCPL